jgi:hypothetical protein
MVAWGLRRRIRGRMMSWRSPMNVIVAKQGNGAIRSALREPADRTWVPVRGHPLLRSGVTLRDLIEREGEGS